MFCSMYSVILVLAVAFLATTTNAFVVTPLSSATSTTTTPGTTTAYTNLDTRRHFDLVSMVSNFGKKVQLSHILIGPPESKTGRGMTKEDATAKLLELKAEIGDDLEKFQAAAEEFSSCKSSKEGGNLGEFGPGLLWKTIDEIAFQKDIGVIHGPVSSPYGEHLVLVRERE
mmetsp:Transcript_18021/g.26666  ORF Transcript_18021/g.26666 Transcript_18021/m.26666 type:complete len:171 (-) Transcript_18021:204-716(-)|eukprot:CAMPEP_0194219664 /NCGR_PEP_ID=MMETSP0156-20130528/26495_1 /TAXON_ID=33649 /ORGANISM="Thalassionema nitzschioides, Strain L26-B" /LENGTH=170 /DNA_ID=CAMNT_0038949417 /DNA_START=59 /DNA_END=571 /DNA_ORIENTATION=+